MSVIRNFISMMLKTENTASTSFAESLPYFVCFLVLVINLLDFAEAYLCLKNFNNIRNA